MIDYHSLTREARRLIGKGRIDEGLDELETLAARRPHAVILRILARYSGRYGRTERHEAAKAQLAALGIEGYGADLNDPLAEALAQDALMRGILGYALRTPRLGGARLYMRWLRGRGPEAERVLTERARLAAEATHIHTRLVNHAACVYAAMSLDRIDAAVDHAMKIHIGKGLLSLPQSLIDFIRPCLWVHPHSAEQATPLWSNRLRKPVDNAGDEAAERPLVLFEGAFAPETAARIIAEAYPRAERLMLTFMTRPPGMIDRFQSYFARDPRWRCDFPDMLIDYTGNYSPFIRNPSGLAGSVGERAFSYLLRNVGASEKAIATLFREPLTLSFEDHIYRYLRVARALEGLFAAGGFDRVLVVSATGTYMFAALTLARQKLGPADVRFSLLGKSPPLQTRLADVARRAMTGRLLTVAPTERFVGLTEHQREHRFSRSLGPINVGDGGFRPSLVRMSAALALQKLTPSYWRRRSIVAERLRRTARLINIPTGQIHHFARRTWIAANLDDRVYGGLAIQLMDRLAPGEPLVFIDYATQDSARVAAFLAEKETQGRQMLVINYRTIMRGMDLNWRGLGRFRSVPFPALFGRDWRRTYPIALGERAMRQFLEAPLTSLLRTVAPLHLNIGMFAWIAVSMLKADRLYIFPTRNTYMRVFSQGARLARTPSFEIQAVLGGRMVRHRAPNTDLCSVLERWSYDYFTSYLGYPRRNLLCGGSFRYDAMMRRARIDMTPAHVAAQRRLCVGDDPRPIVLFGSQPMQMTDNLEALNAVLAALDGRTDVQLVVKLHPAEPKANIAVYVATCAESRGPRVCVAQDVEVDAMMLASSVVVAQTSNILIEAALLGRRAIAMHFGGYEPPIDFQEMGCARVAVDPASLARELKEALDAPPGEAAVDALQKTFLETNAQMLDESFIARMVSAGSALSRKPRLAAARDLIGDLLLPPRDLVDG